MSLFASGWYLLYTKPHHERKASTILQELKITCFLPTRIVLRKWHDRKKYIEEPLFPSYLFVHLEDFRKFYVCLKVEGILKYVRFGKDIAKISESIINNLFLLTEKIKEIEVSEAYFQPGKVLTIREGILTGVSCELVQFNGTEKALVRVELLKRNLLVSLPLSQLMSI